MRATYRTFKFLFMGPVILTFLVAVNWDDFAGALVGAMGGAGYWHCLVL